MQIALDDSLNSSHLIRAYQPGQIQIGSQWIQNSIIVSAKQLITSWPPQGLPELQPEHLHVIIELTPELVLLGTGDRLIFPASSLLIPFYEKQIGIEVMDTPAACRTYNALLSEGRHVVAALLIR